VVHGVRGLEAGRKAALLVSEVQNGIAGRYGIDTIVLCGVSTNIALQGAATEAVALGYSVVLAEDCTAGGTAETHRVQVTMHLPLLATISESASIARSLGRQEAAS
jgi:nicotinamidase-related amidase